MASILIALGLAACGYTLQSSRNYALEEQGVTKVYLAPVSNSSYKPGIEAIVFNEVQKEIASRGRVKIVQSQEDADAVLTGVVYDASFGSLGASRFASGLFPGSDSRFANSGIVGSPDIAVSSAYRANLNCSFTLTKGSRVERISHFKSKKPLVFGPQPSPTPAEKIYDFVSQPIWGSGFARAKEFPNTAQLGVFGTTSGLINQSEFDRALRDLAQLIAADLYDSMLVAF